MTIHFICFPPLLRVVEVDHVFQSGGALRRVG
jgi:hypothetical protein